MVKKILTLFLLTAILVLLGCTTTTNQSMNLNKLSHKQIEEYNNNPENTDKIICRTETPVGSRIPKRFCRLKSVIDSRTRQDQRGLEVIQQSQGINVERDGR